MNHNIPVVKHFDIKSPTLDNRARPDGFWWCPSCCGSGVIREGFFVDSPDHWSHFWRVAGTDQQSTYDWISLYLRGGQEKFVALDILHKFCKNSAAGCPPNNASAWLSSSVREATQRVWDQAGKGKSKGGKSAWPSQSSGWQPQSSGKDHWSPPVNYTLPTTSGWDAFNAHVEATRAPQR